MGIKITPLPQALGATVVGLDLSSGVDAALESRLRHAWYEHLVLFFPGLCLSDTDHIMLGRVFGDLAATSAAADDYRGHQVTGPNGEILVLDAARANGRANTWHTDVTFSAKPPIGSLLSMKTCPSKGGDTLWANQYAAYEALSPAVRDFIVGLEAVHGRPGLTGTSTHPVVVPHPATSRRALFVNRGWTTRIAGLTPTESASILEMLFNHAERPEFTTRWTWRPGDAALWDNRCTMHYAVNDYGDAPRILHRVTIHDTPA